VGRNSFLRNMDVLHGELSARNVTIETILVLHARTAAINRRTSMQLRKMGMITVMTLAGF